MNYPFPRECSKQSPARPQRREEPSRTSPVRRGSELARTTPAAVFGIHNKKKRPLAFHPATGERNAGGRHCPPTSISATEDSVVSEITGRFIAMPPGSCQWKKKPFQQRGSLKIRSETYARLHPMIPRSIRSMLTGITVSGALLLAGCGAFSDQTLVTDGADGAVYLQQLSNRGTTMRYSGPLKAFKASHPIDLAPDTLAKAFAGLSIGIYPSDDRRTPRGVKPAPVFSSQQVAFLAPAVAMALKRAQPDHRIKFQVGSGSDVIDGTLYIEGPVLRLAFSHYHSPADRRDEDLSIYALSFEPREVQIPSVTPQTWMEIEPDLPSVALAYELLAKLPSAIQPAPASPPATMAHPVPASGSAPQTADSAPAIKAVVDKQAQELESLRTELEALKKQLAEQEPKTKSKTKPKATP